MFLLFIFGPSFPPWPSFFFVSFPFFPPPPGPKPPSVAPSPYILGHANYELSVDLEKKTYQK